MHVTITDSTVAAGNPVFEGDTLDLTDSEARLLIRMGKAAPVADDEQPDDEPEAKGKKGGK